ncbi:N-acetylmuramoyl-L-alanine amidase [Anaerostipes sp.]|uniref:N-acetylmuramoyl-L-alanine amidase n=1 Tax=Anaerostipes sp. TaxID=1872530 RepID=UPI0025C45FAA|nr:N-acetylmuramoyl-L-alanine amidase [Anaerostipes sp.]MBS7008739.1 N-acetylmuramoyl-L-alanine amidase [Anaerostipes sp.]
MHKLKKSIAYLSIMMLTVTAIPASSVKAASVPKSGKYYTLKIAGKKQKKKCRNVKVNGKTVKTYAPGFVRANTSMYSAYWLYKKQKNLGVSYSYSSKTKKITLKRGSTSVVMTLDSMYAYVNGKKTKMPTPARKVYSYAQKKNYIYVPGAFCTKKLGHSYKWSASQNSGLITVKNQSQSSSSSGSSSSSSTSQVNPGTRITASESNYSVRIKKPSGLSSSSISTSDDYGNRRLLIKVKGNYKTHFSSSSNRYIKPDKYFRSYTVTYSGGYTNIYIRPRKDVIKAYAVSQTSSYIYVKYDSPKKIYNRIVVLDAGHGGSDSGATGNGLREKDLTLKIVQSAKSYFDKNSGYKVYYTRLSDWYPSLTYRSDLANNVEADRFISVHINSASASAHGTETLYNSKGYKSSSGLTSYNWSNKIHGYVRPATGFTNRGLKNRTGLAVLRNTKTASSLTEIGFISNKTEAKKMKSNTGTYGKAVYNAIVNSFSTYPSKR